MPYVFFERRHISAKGGRVRLQTFQRLLSFLDVVFDMANIVLQNGYAWFHAVKCASAARRRQGWSGRSTLAADTSVQADDVVPRVLVETVSHLIAPGWPQPLRP